MGRKVHPVGFRIGVIRGWQAKWYADKHYTEFLQEDLKLRQAIRERYADAAVSLVEIERQANQVSITIHAARPGIVIGRGGQRVDEMRRYLEKLIGKRVQLNIQEIQQPELDAYLVARTVAEQMERRVAYRRAMKQALLRTLQAGAKGMRVRCAGRLGGAEIARRLVMHEGQVPLHTLRADIDYGFIEARTAMGRIGVKVWIYKGQVLPAPKEEEVEEAATGFAPGAGTVEAEAVSKPAPSPAPESKVEKVEETAIEPVAVAAVEAGEEKPAKPARRRRAKAAASPEPEPGEVGEAPAEARDDVTVASKPPSESGEGNAAA